MKFTSIQAFSLKVDRYDYQKLSDKSKNSRRLNYEVLLGLQSRKIVFKQ